MPSIAELALSALMNSGVMQYPDKNLYKAATLLTPEERPTHQTLAIDPDPKKFPIFRAAPKTLGMWDKNTQTIYMNRKAENYDDLPLLASLLAHEQEHSRRTGQPDQYDEGPAYQRQFDVLKRLGYGNKGYMKGLQNEIAKRSAHDHQEALNRQALLAQMKDK